MDPALLRDVKWALRSGHLTNGQVCLPSFLAGETVWTAKFMLLRGKIMHDYVWYPRTIVVLGLSA
jgi:hypothetical protein